MSIVPSTKIAQFGFAPLNIMAIIVALLNFILGLLFEKNYLIILKDDTGLKFKRNASSLIFIGSYVRKLVA